MVDTEDSPEVPYLRVTMKVYNNMYIERICAKFNSNPDVTGGIEIGMTVCIYADGRNDILYDGMTTPMALTATGSAIPGQFTFSRNGQWVYLTTWNGVKISMTPQLIHNGII